MKLLECARCGSKELLEKEGYVVCVYCGSRFQSEDSNHPTVIDVYSDIQLLLRKCIEDPENRRRYAGLILDIDPSNSEVMKYLY
jgi:transcription elongation factor Elf1